jgi:hypothetical protein
VNNPALQFICSGRFTRSGDGLFKVSVATHLCRLCWHLDSNTRELSGLSRVHEVPFMANQRKTRRPFPGKIACLVLLVFSYLSAAPLQPACGQLDPDEAHKVWASPSSRKSSEASWEVEQSSVYTGTIKQFDAQELVLLEAATGQLTRIDSSRIDRVEFDWANEQATQFAKLVSERAYEDAVRKLDEALKSGLPRWQQRFLVAAAVRCLEALDSQRSAGILFLNLAASSPPPMLYADMPLAWTARETPSAVQSKATEWLASSDEVAQLLGASWLLFGADGETAQATLGKLRTADNPTIAMLAQAQYWRTVPPPQTLSRLPEWLQLIETLPQPLRIGPTEFVADRLMRIGEPDLAIGYWVRIASLHPERYHRAAFALQTAKKLLERNDRLDEAERLTPWIEELSTP